MRVGVGLVMAFVGSLLLVGTNAAQILRADLRGPIALTIASMAWAMGTVLMKRRPSPANPFANATVQMIGGGATLLLAGLLLGEGTTASRRPREGVVAFVYLIAFGSLAGFGAYAYALHYMSPTAMGTYAYVNPVVAVIIGPHPAGRADLAPRDHRDGADDRRGRARTVRRPSGAGARIAAGRRTDVTRCRREGGRDGAGPAPGAGSRQRELGRA